MTVAAVVVLAQAPSLQRSLAPLTPGEVAGASTSTCVVRPEENVALVVDALQKALAAERGQAAKS